MQLVDVRVVSDNYKFFYNYNLDKMDYRQKVSINLREKLMGSNDLRLGN